MSEPIEASALITFNSRDLSGGALLTCMPEYLAGKEDVALGPDDNWLPIMQKTVSEFRSLFLYPGKRYKFEPTETVRGLTLPSGCSVVGNGASLVVDEDNDYISNSEHGTWSAIGAGSLRRSAKNVRVSGVRLEIGKQTNNLHIALKGINVWGEGEIVGCSFEGYRAGEKNEAFVAKVSERTKEQGGPEHPAGVSRVNFNYFGQPQSIEGQVIDGWRPEHTLAFCTGELIGNIGKLVVGKDDPPVFLVGSRGRGALLYNNTLFVKGAVHKARAVNDNPDVINYADSKFSNRVVFYY